MFQTNDLCVAPTTTTMLIVSGTSKMPSEIVTIHEGEGGGNCPVSMDFDVQDYDSTAGLLQNDKVVICGGKEKVGSKHIVSNTCYLMQKKASGSNLELSLSTSSRLYMKRWKAVSIVINNGRTLWVTGGRDTNGKSLESTELVSLAEGANSLSIQPGPELPLDIDSHCLVKLNSSTAMQFGGRSGSNLVGSSLFLDIPQSGGQTIPLKKLNMVSGVSSPFQGVHGHTCGILANPGSEETDVVISTGGYWKKTYTLMWVVKDDIGESWTIGPHLPTGIHYASGVTSTDRKSFFLVGGNDGASSSAIYKLGYNNDNEDWQWTKLDQELQFGRLSHVVLKVPNSFCKEN